MYDVLIIGGGAAGLFAAAACSEAGLVTAVIEKNRILGKKLLITGKGRCNVTNNCDVETVLRNIPTNPKFLYSAVNRFTPADTMELFEKLGVRLKTERGNRVFPVSDKAADIQQALVNKCKANGVRFVTSCAKEVICRNGQAVGVKHDKGESYGKYILIATGGCSYPATGSTGDGFRFAKQLGHTVSPVRPSLVPVVTRETEPAEMAGLSLRNVTLSVYKENKPKPVFSEMGELLFTHFGLSGPLTLSASAHIRDDGAGYKFVIDLKPALGEEKLDKRVQRDFLEAKNRDFKNSLGKLLPPAMIPVIVARSGIAGGKKVNDITKKERMGLVKILKGYTLTMERFRPVEEAIITSGGVSVKEIDPASMESKLVTGLYFAGEVIDCDAYTGGFNLQIAFSTAKAFADAVISKESRKTDNE